VEGLSVEVKFFMDVEKKKCMVCGKPADLKGGICEPCNERIRQEARGGQAELKGRAEKELKKLGVDPDHGKAKK
jgi:predicted amidophosphoribosyltransferase